MKTMTKHTPKPIDVKTFMESLGATQYETANGYWYIEGQGFIAPWQAFFFWQQLEAKIADMTPNTKDSQTPTPMTSNEEREEPNLTEITKLIMREYKVGYAEAAHILDYAIKPVKQEVIRRVRELGPNDIFNEEEKDYNVGLVDGYNQAVAAWRAALKKVEEDD